MMLLPFRSDVADTAAGSVRGSGAYKLIVNEIEIAAFSLRKAHICKALLD